MNAEGGVLKRIPERGRIREKTGEGILSKYIICKHEIVQHRIFFPR